MFEEIINTFTNEELKIEGIKKIQSDTSKVNIIKTFTDINLVEKSLKFVQSDSSKVSIINELPNESDRLNLSNNTIAKTAGIPIKKISRRCTNLLIFMYLPC